MDMQLYMLHVVPVVVIFYGVFVLFMHPPVKVIAATLAGGLVMALLNMAGDLAAIHASLWYYNASGLIAQLPCHFISYHSSSPEDWLISSSGASGAAPTTGWPCSCSAACPRTSF